MKNLSERKSYKKRFRLPGKNLPPATEKSKRNTCGDDMTFPSPPASGDRAALIAPSFAVTPQQLAQAEKSIRLLGLEPVIFPSCRSRKDYLAGSDQLRAGDLETSFADSSLKAVFCLRGGYGAARLLDLIDFDVIRQNPKFFIGFSDITALHTAFNQKCHLVTYHGPMPSAPYTRCDSRVTLYSLRQMLCGKPGKKDFSIRLKRAKLLFRPSGQKTVTPYDKTDIVMKGRLCGGNLTVLAASLGTPYEIDTTDKILFLEDVGERTYRIDRALTSLRLAGKIACCSGILLGTFSDCHPARGGRTCEEIIKEAAEVAGVPVVSGLPCGHSAPHLTLPMGAWCQVSRIPPSAPDSSQTLSFGAESPADPEDPHEPEQFILRFSSR